MIFNTMTSSSTTHHHEESSSKKHEQPDGSSIELPKRPRGRPPGSKNKPKPPIIITRDSDPQSTMRPYILEIPSGHDVLDSLLRFSRRKNLGLCVLGGTGAVANLTLRQPPHPTSSVPAAQATTVGFGGRFEVLSLSATVMPPAVTAGAVTASVTVAGPSGQVIGGTVVGPLVAAGTVTVVAAAFENPTFCRLPAPEEEEDEVPASEEGSEHQHQQEEEMKPPQQQQRYAPHLEFQQHHRGVGGGGGGDSCGMIYSSHFPSEVIWAPTARPQHPPPY